MGIAPKPKRKPYLPPADPRKPSPEALAAFYRHRSESLQASHTVRGKDNAQMRDSSPQGQLAQKGMRPTNGWIEYVISALQGHPGAMKQ